MTHEEVDKLDDILRKVRDMIREAGRMVRAEPGDATGEWLRMSCNSISELVSCMLHESHRLRPEFEDENG